MKNKLRFPNETHRLRMEQVEKLVKPYINRNMRFMLQEVKNE